MPPPTLPAAVSTPERQRISIELSPAVALLLDNIAEVTGTPKSQLVGQALLDALPGYLERVEALQRAAAALRAGKKR